MKCVDGKVALSHFIVGNSLIFINQFSSSKLISANTLKRKNMNDSVVKERKKMRMKKESEVTQYQR